MVLDGLSQDHNELIGFVVSCLFASAITLAEMRAWTLHMIEKHEVDDLPLYMFDLVDFDDPLYKIGQVIGFVCGWKHTRAEDLALEGIAIARGFEPYETAAPHTVLLKRLKEHPQVLQKFKDVFPFIDLAGVEKKFF